MEISYTRTPGPVTGHEHQPQIRFDGPELDKPCNWNQISNQLQPARQWHAAEPDKQRGSGAQPQPGANAHLRSASDIADCITDNIETPEPNDVIA